MKKLLIVAVALLGLAPSAQAAYPGQNGKIAFTTLRDGNWEIYAMNAGGSGQARLTDSARDDLEPSWSPDGSKIAFTSGREGTYDVFVMNADGSGAVNLTNAPGSWDSEPTWSPDGQRIAFRSDRSGNEEIHVMDADGSDVVNLTNYPGGDFEPAWSPDGRAIAFQSTRSTEEAREIYVMDADGSNPRKLTDSSGHALMPSWSPDGQKLAFRFCCPGSGDEIHSMNADGTRRVNLTNHPSDDLEPGWSPDGQKIVFTSHRDNSYQLYSMNADGSGPVQLTQSTENHPNRDPDWQPIPSGPNQAPDCSAVVVTPDTILPATRDQIKTVALSGAIDADNDALAFHMDGVTQDEPVSGVIGDETSPDAQLVGGTANTNQVGVRAERNPKGDGRVYRIAYTVSDGRGGACSGTEAVSVPRKRGETAIDSGPPRYDSFNP